MSHIKKLKYKLNEYYRVFKVTKKPNAFEYKTILKISALGIAIVGAIGFVIQMTVEVLKRN